MERKICQCEYCVCEGDEKHCPFLRKIAQLNQVINSHVSEEPVVAKVTWPIDNGGEAFLNIFDALRKIGVFVYESPNAAMSDGFGIIVSNKELTEEQIEEADNG